ncbi:hypothetical protein EMIHUDRAFT_227762 [Emiliania huxleyi CCMP1516]|uniref:Uncharacterized protein n=2 Tax=Emiliania huxleyi TaxID=2903 RepID=A0A0D3KHG9_EMIH1|nr:hypothetical protein EMIHUDRAFT_227757 [Emiliania huxleyi CCMP1516]XP_005787633.1 hypothetical protein EMIHUDRAFT_227762 [Emiliania huxleyi CCMP1516]EOD35201.1 hypothetical protein EMIHUDRAFT_227757 [Emiliania huxleyi CCMP1516]EOD35204.1 hypothetical protein EMIHUDRAFT_227762 [Emiliania huxleyi CCMP1516]|eukprot:XP_005787630.1 hypothetical protein EMIHUDRAFT_227757 [Emiliania huxleyi CCMP1516]
MLHEDAATYRGDAANRLRRKWWDASQLKSAVLPLAFRQLASTAFAPLMACLPLLLHALAQPRVRIPSAGVQVINAKTGGQLSCLVEGQDEDTVRAEITDPSLGRVLRRIVTQCCKPNVAGSGACVRVYNRGRSCTSGKPPAEPITKRTYAEAVAACAEIGRNEEGVPFTLCNQTTCSGKGCLYDSYPLYSSRPCLGRTPPLPPPSATQDLYRSPSPPPPPSPVIRSPSDAEQMSASVPYPPARPPYPPLDYVQSVLRQFSDELERIRSTIAGTAAIEMEIARKEQEAAEAQAQAAEASAEAAALKTRLALELGSRMQAPPPPPLPCVFDVCPGELHDLMMEFAYTMYRRDDRGDVASSMMLFRAEVVRKLNIEGKTYDDIIAGANVTFSPRARYSLSSKLDGAFEQLVKQLSISARMKDTLVNFVDVSTTIESAKFLQGAGALKQAWTRDEFTRAFAEMIVDVAISSRAFWFKPAVRISEDAKSVIKADISGAVIGGTWGAVTGSFAGGIGALPGGLLGGMISATYGSAAAGLWSLW